MWIRKWFANEEKPNQSPIPTELCSNEEFVTPVQTADQQRWGTRIRKLAGSYSRKLGLSRRRFLQTSGGMAVATLACNEVFGKTREVDPIKALNPSAFAEKFPVTDPFLHSKERSSLDPVVTRDFDKYFLHYIGGTSLQDGTKGADIDLFDSNKNIRAATVIFFRDDSIIPPNQINPDGTLTLYYQMSRFNDVITTLRYEKPLYVLVNGATGWGYIGSRMWEGTGEQEGV